MKRQPVEWGLNGNMRSFDFKLLSYCRDLHCKIRGPHQAHGLAARALTVDKAPAVLCTDDDCDDDSEHAPHDVKADKAAASRYTVDGLKFACADCGTPCRPEGRCGYCGCAAEPIGTVDGECLNPGVSPILVEITYSAVGQYVPTAFSELVRCVSGEYGKITDRSVQRALRALIDERRVASLCSAWLSRESLRNPRVKPPGWYIRYDSPKLWRKGGLHDLMSVVADHQTDSFDSATASRSVARG